MYNSINHIANLMSMIGDYQYYDNTLTYPNGQVIICHCFDFNLGGNRYILYLYNEITDGSLILAALSNGVQKIVYRVPAGMSINFLGVDDIYKSLMSMNGVMIDEGHPDPCTGLDATYNR